MAGITGLIRSKRFWSAVAAIISVVANDVLGIGIDPALIVGLGAALVGGYALQDAAAAYSGPPPTQTVDEQGEVDNG